MVRDTLTEIPPQHVKGGDKEILLSPLLNSDSTLCIRCNVHTLFGLLHAKIF